MRSHIPALFSSCLPSIAKGLHLSSSKPELFSYAIPLVLRCMCMCVGVDVCVCVGVDVCVCVQVCDIA